MKREIFEYQNFSHCSTGIYKISIGNHFYIGSASSKQGFCGRWSKHLAQLRNGGHFNPILQNCYNKYDEIKFEVLELCDPKACIEREQYYVDTLNPDINIRREVVNSPLGTKQKPETIEKRRLKLLGHTCSEQARRIIGENTKRNFQKENGPYGEEWKRKISEAHVGQFVSRETKEKHRKNMLGNDHAAKKLYQYSKDKKTFIKEWNSIEEVRKTLGIKGTHISSCCTGKRASSDGYFWSHTKLE